MTAILAWHFLPADGRLRHGVRTPIVASQTLRHDGPLVLCQSGLHASVRALEALRYAPGPVVSLVRCAGETIHGDDKIVCRERTALWLYDATEELKLFAHEAALSVAHLWDCPPVVRRYLEMGDESIRAAAWDAAMDAAWAAAAMSAARSAARSAANAAMDVEWAAVNTARSAAWAAADAARDDLSDLLESILLAGAPGEVIP